MRQRGVKHRGEIIEDCKAYLLENPMENKGNWKNLLNCNSLFLEIGSGKGQFICNMAQKEPEKFFLACEGGENIGIRILQKAKNFEISNLRLIAEYIIKPTDYFADNELDGIFINFCDPWPKARHAHRRLTHHLLLEEYKKIIKPGGFLAFKTDNDALFAFSLEEFELAALKPIRLTDDLHNSPWESENVHTEYEDKFAATGKNIHYAYIEMP